MGTLVVMILLGAVSALEANKSCDSGQYTTNGECCQQCPPGEGVIKMCGATQTVCTQCLDSETFSENYSHMEVCQSCTQCTGLMRIATPCTDSNDATCICDYGYFMSELSRRCEPCTVCPEGQGVLERCDRNTDTICEECVDDTYSEQESLLDPCLPCSSCDEPLELQLQACTTIRDTICQALNPPTSFSPSPSLEPLLPSFTDNTLLESSPESATATNPSSLRPFSQGLNEKLIPIYCSILAAVVVGIVAFFIFKRWNSYKQSKQGANNCTVNQTPSPEGEKLHSDSGISVDSQSLQEQQQHQSQTQTVVNIDGESNLTLPPHKCEEMEKLLNQGCQGEGTAAEEDTDWCNLAGLLGYEEEHIDFFRQEAHPIRALLSDWASKDCASMDVLCTALRKINRDDIAQSLALNRSTECTATSAV